MARDEGGWASDDEVRACDVRSSWEYNGMIFSDFPHCKGNPSGVLGIPEKIPRRPQQFHAEDLPDFLVGYFDLKWIILCYFCVLYTLKGTQHIHP